MTEQLVLGGRAGDTLDEVLTFGQGVERPFCCPVHGDSHASASVNVLKGVWFCHRCFARGRVDDKRTPTDEELLALMRPDAPERVYPEEWLALFTPAEYWAGRFPAWLCWLLGLGHDPFTGDATFPVRLRDGRLAGVGRRKESGEWRYLYPRNWSASHSLAGVNTVDGKHRDVVVLVEGIADAAACLEVGADTFGCYGAGLHMPQLEIILAMTPRLVLSAFDADDAGRRANERAVELLAEHTDVAVVDWRAYGGKDPAELDAATRLRALAESVASTTYGSVVDPTVPWADTAYRWIEAHEYREE